MITILLACLALAASLGTVDAASAAAPAPPAADSWSQVRFLEGEWVGTAKGEPGVGTVHRSYQFVLGGRFLHERNVSAYSPKQPNTPGELHEHWSFLSFDKRRKALVLRQFHQEGFVNQYVLSAEESTPRRLVFVSEGFENLGERWRAREIYEVGANDEFTETFELAEPGKSFEVYSRNSFRRATPR
jgi:hypothetical protein